MRALAVERRLEGRLHRAEVGDHRAEHEHPAILYVIGIEELVKLDRFFGHPPSVPWTSPPPPPRGGLAGGVMSRGGRTRPGSSPQPKNRPQRPPAIQRVPPPGGPQEPF